MEVAIIILGALYFIAHLLAHFSDHSKIPDVLILILFGIFVGPVMQWVHPEEFGAIGKLFTSIALIIILFEGGLNLELNTIAKSMSQVLKITLIFFFVTAACVAGVMHLIFSYALMPSIITGFILGGTSSAVVIPLVNALRIGKETSTLLILESALTDVLCIVFTIGFLRGTAAGEVNAGDILGSLISALVLASLIGALAGIFWLRMLDKIRSFPNTQFTTFAFMFIVYGVAEYLNFSGAIAALAFGIVLGNNHFITRRLSKYTDKFSIAIISDAEKSLYKEIVFLLKLFFFIFLGISIPFENATIVTIALIIVGIVYLARLVATRFVIPQSVSWQDKSIISVMVPKGLAAAVLAGLPLQMGMVEGSDIQAISFNVVLASIMATSLLIPLIENTPLKKVYHYLFGQKQKPASATEVAQAPAE